MGQPDSATVFTLSHGTPLTPQVTYQRQSHGTLGKETLEAPEGAERGGRASASTICIVTLIECVHILGSDSAQ